MHPWQKPQFDYFCSLKASGRLPHGLLLTGKEGMGKSDFARIIAKTIFCVDDSSFEACGVCKACQLIGSNSHPDLIEVKPTGKMEIITVDQIRQLVVFLQERSQQGGYRVIIIHDAHCMNIAAANALLKSLEEPGANTLIILQTSAAHLLLPTIKSRVQTIEISAKLDDAMRSWLGQSDEGCDKLWAISLGSPLKAAMLAKENALNQYNDLLQKLLSQTDPIELAQEYIKVPLAHVLLWVTILASDLIKVKTNINELQLVNENLRSSLIAYVQNISLDDLYALLKKCYELKEYLNQKVKLNEQLFLEDLFIVVVGC